MNGENIKEIQEMMTTYMCQNSKLKVPNSSGHFDRYISTSPVSVAYLYTGWQAENHSSKLEEFAYQMPVILFLAILAEDDSELHVGLLITRNWL